MPEQHRPAEFSEILNSPEQPLIVGGQAVNIWAEYYSARNPRLAALQPFVSKDADIFGDRALAAKLAEAPGWKIRYFHEPRSIAVAVLTKDVPHKPTLTVEVLRSVRGLTSKELVDSDVVALRPGETYRIPSPIRLLKAKLANLREIKPARDHDIRHARLLVDVARDYLKEQHEHVLAGHLSERQWINAFHELRDVISQPTAKKLSDQFGLGVEQSLPAVGENPQLPKITALGRHLHPKKPAASRKSP